MFNRVNGGGSDAPFVMMAEDYDDQHDYRASEIHDEEDIERLIMEDMEDDERLRSGAGKHALEDNDVAFVKITGLTQPDAESAPWPDAEAEPELLDDIDPTVPISFFEEGVDDVDDAGDPTTVRDRPLPNDDELVTPTPQRRDESAFLRDLKAIVSDMSSAQFEKDDDLETTGAPMDAAQCGSTVVESGDVVGNAVSDIPPEWTRHLDAAEEPPRDSGWDQRGYDELDADMLDWIAQKLEADDDATGDERSQWQLGGRQYTLEMEPAQGDKFQPEKPTDKSTPEGAEQPQVDARPLETPPSRPRPPWAEYRSIIEEDDSSEQGTSESPDAPSSGPRITESSARLEDASRELEPAGDVVVPAASGADWAEPPAALPLPAPSVRTRELSRAQELMNSFEPSENEFTERAGASSHSAESTQASWNEPASATAGALATPADARTTTASRPSSETEADSDAAGGAFSPRRRTRHRRRNWLRVLLRAFFTLVIIAALGAAAAAAWWWYQRWAESPEAAFSRAKSKLASGDYAAASAAFLGFTENFPQSALKADALFNAAYALQAIPAAPKSEADNAYQRSLALFDRFVEQYPGHMKNPRAQVMAAVLQYRLDEYEDAIARLQNSDDRTSDPLTYLPSLR
ncbi:MAG: outer membrane protein assembly factor BamD, partial [Candidatus Hydrogenedentales bacterium]